MHVEQVVPTVSAPRQVGPYRLVERLGLGGMGEVWLAEDPTGAAGGAPRQVALKLLAPGLVADADARARFEREVDAARRIRSACVAMLLDADVGADQPWLASAYVAGPTLDEHVSRHGPLAGGPLRALGAALAEALVAIHEAGVVHRDLTPRNVVLGPDGPRVVDFGIAWFADAEEITQVGAFVGTPAWMAPERLRHGPVTAASDVWSWGAVMAYAARGVPPWADAGSPAATRPGAGAGDSDVDGDGVGDGVPSWLDAVVTAAMADDPRARPTARHLYDCMIQGPTPLPPTAGDAMPPTRVEAGAATALAPAAGGTRVFRFGQASRATSTAPSPGRRNRRRLVRWGSGLLVLAAAAGVAAVADLLLTVIMVAVMLLVAVAMGLAGESRPAGVKPVPPTWGFALGGPLALGVGVAQVVGPWGGAGAVLALVLLFFLIGGDFG